MSKTLDFLKEHESQSPSRFVEMATWRKENDGWLRWSRNIALSLIDYMQSEELGVTPQYVSKILSGKVNFSFKSVYEIENKLGISCMSVNLAE